MPPEKELTVGGAGQFNTRRLYSEELERISDEVGLGDPRAYEEGNLPEPPFTAHFISGIDGGGFNPHILDVTYSRANEISGPSESAAIVGSTNGEYIIFPTSAGSNYWTYDPSTDTATDTGVSATTNEEFYVANTAYQSPDGTVWTFDTDHLGFDPDANQQVGSRTPHPQRNSGWYMTGSMAVNDPNDSDIVYCVGGRQFESGGFNSGNIPFIYSYEISTDTWTQRASLPSATDTGSENFATFINGLLYFTDSDNQNVYTFDPSDDSITQVGSGAPDANTDPRAAIEVDDDMWVFGASSESIEVFNTSDNTWQSIENLGYTNSVSIAISESAAKINDPTFVEYFPDYSSQSSFDVSSNVSDIQGFSLSADGGKMFLSDINGEFHQYSLSTNWDITSASFDATFSTGFINANGLAWDAQGYRAYTSVNASDEELYQYFTDDPYNVSGLQLEETQIISGDISGDISDIYLRPDGNKIYVTDTSNNTHQYTFGTPWNVTTVSLDGSADVSSGANYDAMTMGNYGRWAYTVNSAASNLVVTKTSLDSVWDITSGIGSIEQLTYSEGTAPLNNIQYRTRDDRTVYLASDGDSSVHQLDIVETV